MIQACRWLQGWDHRLAIVVAAVAAISQHQGLGLSRKEIADISYRLEKKVQQGLGSPMDTALATYGGYLQISQRYSAP